MNEAISLSNQSEFGLQGSVYGKNISECLKIADAPALGFHLLGYNIQLLVLVIINMVNTQRNPKKNVTCLAVETLH